VGGLDPGFGDMRGHDLDPGFEAFHGGTEGDLTWKAVPLGDGTREEAYVTQGCR
jgi:hypothetical protein